MKLFLRKAAEKQIQPLYNVAPDICAYSDADMINAILRNLVGNTIKFTHKGGQIEIITEKNGGDITHTVKNVGVGSSKEGPTQIYSDNYYTTLNTGKKLGTGLGLMICRDFIKSIKGNFKVLGAPGEGACFIITLPAAK